MARLKYGKHIITDLIIPESVQARAESYSKWATRILWMDKDVVPGAFQMNCSWYLRPPDVKTPEAQSHVHDADEIIGFFGNNPQDPYKLGAEIEFWLEDEMYIITSSAMIFVPRGMKHCPLILRRVDRPIFHFSTVTAGKYLYIKED